MSENEEKVALHSTYFSALHCGVAVVVREYARIAGAAGRGACDVARGGSGSTSTEKKKLDSKEFADKILKNTLSPSDSMRLHTMLTEILNDCMGQTMLQEIYNKGTQISITFDSTIDNSRYNFDSSIVMKNDHSEGLVHELFHYYQHQRLGSENFSGAKANYEIEAYLATYMYMDRAFDLSMYRRQKLFAKNAAIGVQINQMYALIFNDATFVEYNNEKEDYFHKLFLAAAKKYSNTNDHATYNEEQSLEQHIQNLKEVSVDCE